MKALNHSTCGAGVSPAVAQATGCFGDPVHTGTRPGRQGRSRLDVCGPRHVRRRQAVVPFGHGVPQMVASLRVDAGTRAPECVGPARVPGPATGRIGGAGQRP